MLHLPAEPHAIAALHVLGAPYGLSALHVLAAIPLLIWLYLFVARGGFWRVSRLVDAATPGAAPRAALNGARSSAAATAGGASAPRVIAVIPARDEADSIGVAVRSLLQQRFEGSLQIIVVDDGSTDGTAAAAASAGAHTGSRLTVLQGAPLIAGWTGKLWALNQGVEAAQALAPDYLLLTDADIEHAPDCLKQLITRAKTEGRDLVSYMVRLSVDTLAERCLIPAFVFFFFMLYPPRWIGSARSRTAGAAGGCILIRPQSLERIGGLAALRTQIIDDCALARAVKHRGGRLWLGLTRSALSLRRYGSFAEVGSMISRTAFNQLGHSYLLLVLTVLGLGLTYLLPPLLLLSGDTVAVALGVAAWVLMSICYLPMVRFYGLSAAWSACLPGIAAFYAGATVHSAVQYGLGRGGLWKGRAQDVARDAPHSHHTPKGIHAPPEAPAADAPGSEAPAPEAATVGPAPEERAPGPRAGSGPH